MTDHMSPVEPLAQRIRDQASTAAERKVAAALADGFPSQALGTVETLAGRAGVSGPTVLRYLAKLGFARFADFRAEVLQEIDRQLGSPLRELDQQGVDGPETGGGHLYERFLLMQADALRRTAVRAVAAEFDAIADRLADRKLGIRVLGGRYSRFLAQRLVVQLAQVRPDVILVEQPLGFAYDALIDIGPRDLIVMFDYRRYQPELLRFGREAREAGARICLLTDLWQSPLAALAEAVLTAPDDSASPFGSRVVPTAQIEALVAAVVERDRETARARLARIEKLRAGEGIEAGSFGSEPWDES